MRRYLVLMVVIFLSFGMIALISLFYVGSLFGASATPAMLAEIQMRRPDAIVLPFDLRYNGAFKLQRVEQEHPEVIWFSSSRAGQTRADMFKPYRFYNMSFTAWTTEQLADIFERTTRNVRPRVAIISLDYFLFTDSWEEAYSSTRSMTFDQPFRYLKSSLVNFIHAIVARPLVFQAYLSAPLPFVGPQAILSQEGFRGDGSYVYSTGHIEGARLHEQTADFLVSAMPGAPKMSDRQKVPIMRIAEIARQRGIKLVAVQLPLIRAGVDYLDNNEAYRAYSGVWRDFEGASTREWLESLGITFFDLARSPVDDDGLNFVDAYHPSSLGTLRLMRGLLGTIEFRAVFPAIDPQQIDQQIADISAQADILARTDHHLHAE
jgi:hypothetical protein